jgi:acetyl/propionyl-CoA carboxylase alpha subunit
MPITQPNRASTGKLISAMQGLIDAIRTGESLDIKLGDVLGALEVFTFANFTKAEQEIIFHRAKARIDSMEDNEPITQKA